MKPILSISLFALTLVTLAGLVACSHTTEPNVDAFVTPMHDYLATHGDLCLAKNTWPIDVTQHEVDVGARNALQMPVLEKLGLVSSSVAEIDVDDEGTAHHMKVRRYALTGAGQKFYLVRASSKNEGSTKGSTEGASQTAQSAVTSGDFCAARLSLDHIVSSNLQQNGNAQQAVVTYTYQVAAAPWTQDAEVQKVFPVVAKVVHGAGSAQLQETFTMTKNGWVAVDLQGS
jgi:hypothetical protein